MVKVKVSTNMISALVYFKLSLIKGSEGCGHSYPAVRGKHLISPSTLQRAFQAARLQLPNLHMAAGKENCSYLEWWHCYTAYIIVGDDGLPHWMACNIKWLYEMLSKHAWNVLQKQTLLKLGEKPLQEVRHKGWKFRKNPKYGLCLPLITSYCDMWIWLLDI